MRIVRVTAAWRDSGSINRKYKFTLLCGISNDNRIENGEWTGYVVEDSIYWPFVLQDGERCFYGREDHYTEQTNIGNKAIKAGEFFTIESLPGADEPWEAIYEIISVHPY